jgi:hypothetical protein
MKVQVDRTTFDGGLCAGWVDPARIACFSLSGRLTSVQTLAPVRTAETGQFATNLGAAELLRLYGRNL